MFGSIRLDRACQPLLPVCRPVRQHVTRQRLSLNEARVQRIRVKVQAAAEHGVDQARSNGSSQETQYASDRLHQLHKSSEALRSLLQRRAERQKSQIDPDQSHVLLSRPSAPSVPAEVVPIKRVVNVKFFMKFHVDYGQQICLVGSIPEIGNWILSDSVSLSWNEGDIWCATLELPSNSVIEYKYVVVGHGGHAVAWQSGNNSVLALTEEDEEVEVHDNWGGNPGAKVVVGGNLPVTREKKLLSWATDLESQVIQQRQELRKVRMELLAAQEEARIAREESKKLKAQLAKSEAERLSSIQTARETTAVNAALHDQIKNTTASFRQALETAVDILEGKKPSKATKTSKVSTADTKVDSN